MQQGQGSEDEAEVAEAAGATRWPMASMFRVYVDEERTVGKEEDRWRWVSFPGVLVA